MVFPKQRRNRRDRAIALGSDIDGGAVSRNVDLELADSDSAGARTVQPDFAAVGESERERHRIR